MNMSKKLPVLFGLCLAFAVVLTIIYSLVGERMDYASAVLNINQSSDSSGINDYRMIARSIKYGMLLVIFTFAVFFLYEVLHKWRIHPMQYLLVGGALSVFYLLLLSLAEHIGFINAYLLAAVACIGLIIWYLQFVIIKRRSVFLIGTLLVLGYVVIFVLLRLPTFSLMIGSLLVFLALAIVMYLTRKVDWYALIDQNTSHDENRNED